MSRYRFPEPGVTKAVLAFGSNLGDREETIVAASMRLAEHKKVKLVALSSMYESVAVTAEGEDESQPSYLNAVGIFETELKPSKLHKLASDVENEFGRVRLARWAPRTLDIDIITFGTELIETKKLVVPHPRAFERAFVLVPWLEVDPDAVIPGRGKISALVSELATKVVKQP